MNKYEYIAAIAANLNSIPVSGYKNLNALLGALQALQRLENVLHEEDDKRAQEDAQKVPDPEAE